MQVISPDDYRAGSNPFGGARKTYRQQDISRMLFAKSNTRIIPGGTSTGNEDDIEVVDISHSRVSIFIAQRRPASPRSQFQSIFYEEKTFSYLPSSRRRGGREPRAESAKVNANKMDPLSGELN